MKYLCSLDTIYASRLALFLLTEIILKWDASWDGLYTDLYTGPYTVQPK